MEPPFSIDIPVGGANIMNSLPGQVICKYGLEKLAVAALPDKIASDTIAPSALSSHITLRQQLNQVMNLSPRIA